MWKPQTGSLSAASLRASPHIYLRRSRHHKFESRDEWLGIRDWGLGVTGILRHRHPERSRGIFTALRESACMRRGKTMSWCCLTCDDERSAIKISRLTLEMTMRAKRYQNSAALLIFMRRTSPLKPLEPIEPTPPLSSAIKRRYAREANPEP